jgi:hypothetical protein
MAKYPSSVPAGFYSDGESDEDEYKRFGNENIEINILTKKHRMSLIFCFLLLVQSFSFIFPGDEIPDIGFRAGINGSHFNIKLGSSMQKKFEEIAEMWKSKLKNRKTWHCNY